MADDHAAIAHLLRRATFGPVPGQVEALNAGGVAAALNQVLAATPPPLPAPTPGFASCTCPSAATSTPTRTTGRVTTT